MKKIKLTHGAVALVDDEDFEHLNQFKWHLSDGGYAHRTQYKPKPKAIRMHRVINKTPDKLFTDHINQDKLDNRRTNLRTVNKSQNSINTGLRSTNKSGHKGVYWDSWSRRWRAELKINYKKITLGRYTNINDAIKARKLAELKYHAV